jgi:ERCC4-type nuclease
MRTISIEETAMYIVYSAKKLLKNPEKKGYFEINKSDELSNNIPSILLPQTIQSSSSSSSTPSDISNIVEPIMTVVVPEQSIIDKQYIPLVKSTKKLNITENNIDEIMLCQIPGISSQTAQAIILHFGSLQNMILQYSVDGESILSNIHVSRKNSTECKLNKTVIKNIIKFIFKK